MIHAFNDATLQEQHDYVQLLQLKF